MRSVALDVHRAFCKVAIAEAGEVRLVGRVKTEPEALELFAPQPGRDRSGRLGGDGERAGDREGHRSVRRSCPANQSEARCGRSRRPRRRMKSMRACWRSCLLAVSCPRRGSSTSRPGCYAGGLPATLSSLGRAHARRIKYTRS